MNNIKRVNHFHTWTVEEFFCSWGMLWGRFQYSHRGTNGNEFSIAVLVLFSELLQSLFFTPLYWLQRFVEGMGCLSVMTSIHFKYVNISNHNLTANYAAVCYHSWIHVILYTVSFSATTIHLHIHHRLYVYEIEICGWKITDDVCFINITNIHKAPAAVESVAK